MLTEIEKARIDAMSREELAIKLRFAPIGDKFWQGEHGDYAMRRFRELGSMSPEISKKIGWD